MRSIPTQTLERKNKMDALLFILRGYVIFIASSSFIFSQIFSGSFAWGATIAGAFGFISGILGGGFALETRLRSVLIIICCFFGLGGVGLDAYNYYANLNIPGNHYAWFMIGPYCVILMLIIWQVMRHMPSNKSSNLIKEV